MSVFDWFLLGGILVCMIPIASALLWLAMEGVVRLLERPRARHCPFCQSQFWAKDGRFWKHASECSQRKKRAA